MKPRMWTVGALAGESGLARSTLLYYDSLGLLKPSGRTTANYRLYSEKDRQRLDAICRHRRMGIPLKEIGRLLDVRGREAAGDILRRRLAALGREIDNLRLQQKTIIQILKLDQFQNEVKEMVNKQRWVEIMRAAGLGEKEMHSWHVQFERMEPQAHQEFLESLGIDAEEIRKIRESCRKA